MQLIFLLQSEKDVLLLYSLNYLVPLEVFIRDLKLLSISYFDIGAYATLHTMTLFGIMNHIYSINLGKRRIMTL